MNGIDDENINSEHRIARLKALSNKLRICSFDDDYNQVGCNVNIPAYSRRGIQILEIPHSSVKLSKFDLTI